MGREVADLYILLRAVADPAGFAAFSAEGEEAAGSVSSSMKKMLPISAAVTGAVLLGAGVSVKWASDFQTAYTKLYTAAGASKEQVLANTDAMLKLGTQTGFTGTEIADALYHPISAGLSLAASLAVVKASAEEAQISGASLDDTTYTLSSVMKAFNFPVQQTTQTMALLNAIVGEGDMHFQDFNASIKNWAPTAAQMNISIQSMGAGLAYLTDRGNTAEEASTRLTMGLTMMATPSAQAAKLLEGLGVASADVKGSTAAMTATLKAAHITQNQLAADLAKPDGLYVALNHLKTSMTAAGVAGTEADSTISKIFGGGRSDKAIMSLMQNLDGLKEKYEQIGKTATPKTFAQAWADAQNTMRVQFDKLKAGAVNLGISIGENLIPVVNAMMKDFLKATDFLSKHKAAMAAVAGVIVMLMVPAIYAATVALGSFLLAAGPFILIGAAIGAAAYEIYTHWSTIVKWLKEAWAWMKSAASETAKWVGHAWDEVAAWTSQAWGKVLGFLKKVWGTLADVWNSTGGVAVAWIAKAWESVSGPIAKEWDKIVGDLSAVWNLIIDLWNATDGKLISLIADHWSAIWGVIKPVLTLLIGDMRTAMILVKTIFQVGWDVVRGVFETAWHLITGILKTAWDIISGVVKVGIDAVETVLSVAWDIISGAVKVVWDIITGTINTVLDELKDSLKLFVDLFTGKWSKLWDDTKKLFSDAWNNIYGMFAGILSTILSTVVHVVVDIWKGFINGIKDALVGIKNALGDILSTTVGFFKDVLTWLYQAGIDLIKGLINGIKSMAGDAVNAVKGVGKSIVGGAKDVLSIFSPSKVFHDIGANVGQGLINGIAASQNGAVAAAQNLAKATLTGFGTPKLDMTTGVNAVSASQILGTNGVNLGVNANANQAQAGTTVVINIQGSVLAEKDLRNTVQTLMLQLGARNSTSYTPYKR